MVNPGAVREYRHQLQSILQQCANRPEFADFHGAVESALGKLDDGHDATGKPKEKQETVTVADRAKRDTGHDGDAHAKAKQEILDRLHAA